MANESLQDLGIATQGGNTASLSSASGTSSSGANVQMSDFLSGSNPVGSISGPTSVEVGDLENYTLSINGSGSRYDRIKDRNANYSYSVSGPASIFNSEDNLVALDFTGQGQVTLSITYTDVYNDINITRTLDIQSESVDPAITVNSNPITLEEDGAIINRTITNSGGGTLSGFIDFTNGNSQQTKVISTSSFTEITATVDSGFGSYSLSAGQSLTVTLTQTVSGFAVGTGSYPEDLRITHNGVNRGSPISISVSYEISSS